MKRKNLYTRQGKYIVKSSSEGNSRKAIPDFYIRLCWGYIRVVSLWRIVLALTRIIIPQWCTKKTKIKDGWTWLKGHLNHFISECRSVW